MRSPLLDVDDALEDPTLAAETDPDLETAAEDGPPPLRQRDYRTQVAKGLRQAGTTYQTRQKRPQSVDGAPVRSPWETLPREGATQAQAQRFADQPADPRVRGVSRDFEGVR